MPTLLPVLLQMPVRFFRIGREDGLVQNLIERLVPLFVELGEEYEKSRIVSENGTPPTRNGF